MKKVYQVISPEEWGHLVTKYAPHTKAVKIQDFTAGTKNIRTDFNGFITKRPGDIDFTQLTGFAKDQYEAIFSDGARHMLIVHDGEIFFTPGDGVEHEVTNGDGFTEGANFEFATMQDRVYGGNGVDKPIVYDRQGTYGGVVYPVPQVREMGAQAPDTALTAGTPTAGGDVPDGTHKYKVTFLYYGSEESNGGPASGAQTAGTGDNTIPLTDIPVGGYGVTARKIYRDDNDGVYLFIHQIDDNTTTSFSDTIDVSATPTPIPTLNNVPEEFSLIALWLDIVWTAGIPGEPFTLQYSDTSLPDVFPPGFRLLCNQEDPITCIIVFNDRLMVFNRKSFGQIIGTTPETFRYAKIPGSAGCVDVRTMQVRILEGVPILVWLADNGFWTWDGSALNYISDPIENLVNFNIQQASQQRGLNTQSSQAQFEAGTASPGIELDLVPGSITTKGYADGTAIAGTNPKRIFDDQADWEAGSVEEGIATKDGTGKLKAVTRFAPAFADGVFNNLIISPTPILGSGLTVPTVTNFTGELASNSGGHVDRPSTSAGAPLGTAIRITLARAGNLNELHFSALFAAGVEAFTVNVYNNSGSLPGSTIYQSGTLNGSSFPLLNSGGGFNRRNVTHTLSVALAAGTYWIGIFRVSGSGSTARIGTPGTIPITGPVYPWMSAPRAYFDANTNLWTSTVFGPVLSGPTITQSYSFCQTPVPVSGQWTSPIYDSLSENVDGVTLETEGDTPGGTLCSGAYSSTGSVTVEGSDDAGFFGGAEVTETVNDLNSITNLGITGKRYWRIKVNISRTVDVQSFSSFGDPQLPYPYLSVLLLKFQNPAIWESPAIDATADVTDFINLDVVMNEPAGTDVTVLIATSANNVSYPDGFVPFGTEVTRRYAKIRVELEQTSDNSVTPDVSSINLGWTLTSNLVSSVIDTAVNPPQGWDLFLASFILNGGEVEFQMRSSSSLIDVAATGQVTVVDYTALAGAVLTVAGHALTEGVHWTAATSNNATADSLASAINALTEVSAANPPLNVITVISTPAGLSGNAVTLATDDAVNLTISGATLTGGEDALVDYPFQDVTPGTFPNVVTPNQYVQWKVIITSSPDDVPEIQSVTVRWFISIVNSIRPASLFYDGSYYVAVAEENQPFNNIILELDSDGKWRIHDGLHISTFSLFFNRPYLGLADTMVIRRFLEGTLDGEEPIVADIRTKALDFTTQYLDNSYKVKVVGSVIIQGKNTGATYKFFYSVDNGVTFYPLLMNSGADSYISPEDETTFYLRFRPDWNAGNPISGKTIMYRVLSEDEFDIELHSIRAEALVREQDPVITG